MILQYFVVQTTPMVYLLNYGGEFIIATELEIS